MRSTAAFVLFLSMTTIAVASGGIGCNVEDHSAKLSIESRVTRGMGGPLVNFRAKLEILDKSVADDLRNIEFKQENVAQYWLDGQSLKLLLYRERSGDKPFGSVELTVETQMRDEGTYEGSYKIVVSDME